MKTTSARTWSRLGKLVLLCVPLVLGTVGFGLAGERPLDALFIALCMYGMEVQDPAPNLWVELARWTAPAATAGGVLMLFAAFRQRLRNALCRLRGDSVAVYGPQEEREALLDQLGPRGIDGGDRLVRAQRYVLLWDEERNLAFYGQHREALAGHVTCLRASSLGAQESAAPDLRIVCPEETAARLFWKEHCLYETSVVCGHRMKLVLLGFGRLGEEVLLRALQNCIFDPGQRIEYHVFGGGEAFPAVHCQLSDISDPVIFHQEPWYDCLDLLEEAQMVLLLTQQGQLALLRELLLALRRDRIHVFSAGGAELLAQRERIAVFDWRAESGRAEHIFSDALFERAKRINLRYAHLYGKVPETEEAKEAEWRKLDTFTRYSNVSSADYHEVQLRMLEAMGAPADTDRMEPDRLELLAHLEHIRWCRYHYLNNWRCGVPENGRNKDPAARIHHDLVPYEELTEAEKEKDRDNIRVLFGVK